MKKYLVKLNPTKCVSFTFANSGIKWVPNRSKVVGEKDIDVYQNAGVFQIGEIESVMKKREGFKRKKVVSPEVNPDDMGETKES